MIKNGEKRFINSRHLWAKELESISPSLNPSHQGREIALAPCGRGFG